MTKLTVVVGGQYGSEGKGAISAHLTRGYWKNGVAIRVAGPNAGHTAYDDDNREWKLRAVPVAAVVSRTCQLHIAAGSEVDLEVLADEINALDAAGHDVSSRLTIHPSATVLEPVHRSMESVSGLVGRIGSTGKGIGAARAARIMRESSTVGESVSLRRFMADCGPFDLRGVGRVLIEGTQGYGLGLHTSNYPKVTSSDCRAIDFLGMAGISPWDNQITNLKVVVVARMYPIRVAGNSGPMKGETSWEKLGLPEERTTVTNKVRRVGEWDPELLDEAITANGGGGWNTDVQIALTMMDQRFPEVRGMTDPTKLPDQVAEYVRDIQDEYETDVCYLGTSPTTVMEVAL